MTQKTVFVPCRIDLDDPIQSIHREVAMQLSPRFRFAGFIGQSESADFPCFHRLRRMETEDYTSRKAIILLQEYLRGYDIIHTGMSSKKDHPLLLQLARLRGTNTVHTHHTTTPLGVSQQRWLANHADIVTAVSPFVKEWVQSTLGRDNVKVIPNGVDLELFHPDQAKTGSDLVLYVGRLVDRKNPQQVLKLAERNPTLRFAIRGDGPLKQELESSASENVKFVGRLSSEELAELYARASVLLCPFENEGFGMVVIEAMAAGTPVLGLNSGNLPHLIDEAGGELVPNLDIDGWSRPLRRIIASSDEYDPRSTASEFSWETVASEYAVIYNRCV